MAFINDLYNLWPHGDMHIPDLRDAMAAQAPDLFRKYGFDTPLVEAHFMAQVSLECGAGTEVVENLNYSPQRMCQVWPSRFRTIADAVPYAHNPKALANKVYNGRMGNVLNSDDGWNFRGRGATQTTGREGYGALGRNIGIDLLSDPDLVNSTQHFLECGVVDFILCGCLPWAQKDDIVMVTRHLNGGETDLADRKDWLRKWKTALGVATAS
jgi:putative chitinase